VHNLKYVILNSVEFLSSNQQERCGMAVTPSEIEALRKDIESQSKAIVRFGILRAAMLLLIAVTFVHAFQRLDASQPEIQSLNSTIDEQEKIVNGESPGDTVSLPRPTPYQNPFAQPYDCPPWSALRQQDPAWIACQKLREAYRQAFLLKLPLIGSNAEVDLRSWIFLAPVVFVLAELYFAILRKKRSLLSKIALPLNKGDDLRDLSVAGRLFLPTESGGEASFVQHPYQYVRVLDVAFCGGLGAFLLVASQPVWHGLNGETIRILLLFYGTVVYYAVSYYSYVACRLSTAVQCATGSTPAESWGYRVWESLKGLIFRARKRLGAKIPINVGSFLLLLTLFLPISIVSCNDASKHPNKYNNQYAWLQDFKRSGESGGVPLGVQRFGKGWDFLLGESSWPPAFYLELQRVASNQYHLVIGDPPGRPSRFSERLGAFGYRLMLGLAILGTLMQLRRLKPKGRRIQKIAYVLSCAVVLFSLTDMAFAWIAPWFSLRVYWLMPVCWLAGLLAVLGSRYVANQRIRRTLDPLATVAGILYTPLPFFAAAFLLPWKSIQFALSFSLYLVGAALLTLGYSAFLEEPLTDA
jgi:cell division protein FtsL